MKYLITETQSQKFLNAMVKFIDAKNYDGLCKLEVDDEPDEDGKFWVYAVFSKKWLDEYPYSSTGGAVKEVTAIAEEVGGFFGFFKKKKPKPTATPVAAKAKKAEAEIWDEGRVVADLAANLSQFFRVQQQLADHIREEEEKSKTVYDPSQNIMESALNRELAKTQFEKLAKEIREIMVYQSPPELGNLYTRVNQMRVIIIGFRSFSSSVR